MAERDVTAPRGTHPRAGAPRRGRVVPGEVVPPADEPAANGTPADAPRAAAGAPAAGGAGPAPESRITEPEATEPEAAEPEANADGEATEPAATADGEAREGAAPGDGGSPDDDDDDATLPAASESAVEADAPSASGAGTAAGATNDAPPGFPTEESLAQQGEATTQLRKAIDELRQLLDVDPVPPAPAPRPRRRRWLLLLPAVAVVAAAAAVALLAPWAPDDDAGTARPAPGTSASAKPSTPATPRLSAPSATAGANLPMPLTPAPGTAPRSGPGVTEPGTLLVVRLAADSSLTVTEQAILARPATGRIPLLRPDLGRLGGDVAALRTRVTRLRAALDGRAAPVDAAGDGRWFVPVTGDTTRVTVSYRVAGAVLPTTDPSVGGRALVLVQPLLGRGLVPQQLPLVVRTAGMAGLGASCPDAPAALSLCGLGDGRGNWTATVPRSPNPVVLVQVDLPT